ncbi:D111/G-patch domain-containing protein [Artemisia annua]|uniref:D111/G-patch domain-containing protein n=1 Tax=Artemisia annua TaxID=35608 RepID=A0A2U1M6M7_ARTAN|nr:D111/G-patch domain-containing protein [Artemisia annua]
MDNRRSNVRQDIRRRQQQKVNEEDEASILNEFADEFRLPINQRLTENVDLDHVEQASLDTQLPSSNVGFRLLQKMGWKGKGLGKNEQGITEPIKSGIRDAKLGLGKQEEDDFFTAEENIQRKKLDIELEETEEVAKKREHICVSFEGNINQPFGALEKFRAVFITWWHLLLLHPFVHIMKIQVMADREIRIETEDSEKSNLPVKTATVLADQDQRKALKFGFSSKFGGSKSSVKSAAKKPKVAVASVFGNDSDEE